MLFLSINAWSVFLLIFDWTWAHWPKNCWGAAELNRSDTLVSTNQGTLPHPIFNGKKSRCCKVAVGNEDANLTMVLSSSSGSRQSGTYATWLSSEVSASGSWKSSYSNNRTILQYTSEMFCTSAMFQHLLALQLSGRLQVEAWICQSSQAHVFRCQKVGNKRLAGGKLSPTRSAGDVFFHFTARVLLRYTIQRSIRFTLQIIYTYVYTSISFVKQHIIEA